MSNVDISFRALVKNNAGFFKSEKQARFLRGQCENDVFVIGGQVFNQGYSDMFFCDADGVVKVVRNTSKGQKVVFERPEGDKADILKACAAKAAAKQVRVDRFKKLNALADHISAKSERFELHNNIAKMKELSASDPVAMASFIAKLDKVRENIKARYTRILNKAEEV